MQDEAIHLPANLGHLNLLWLRDELGENSDVVQETLSVCDTLRFWIRCSQERQLDPILTITPFNKLTFPNWPLWLYLNEYRAC